MLRDMATLSHSKKLVCLFIWHHQRTQAGGRKCACIWRGAGSPVWVSIRRSLFSDGETRRFWEEQYFLAEHY
jgi:hypothetical protein